MDQMEILHHIALPVTDIPNAVDWYERNFNIRRVYEDESLALLSFENVCLALVLPDQHRAHFAVEREDTEAMGAPATHRDRSASVRAEDSRGNMIESLKAARP